MTSPRNLPHTLPASAVRPVPTARTSAGLNRLHQFDKVEIVRVEKPENSYAALLEDNQKDGYIEIPQCLRPYTGFDRID